MIAQAIKLNLVEMISEIFELTSPFVLKILKDKTLENANIETE